MFMGSSGSTSIQCGAQCSWASASGFPAGGAAAPCASPSLGARLDENLKRTSAWANQGAGQPEAEAKYATRDG